MKNQNNYFNLLDYPEIIQLFSELLDSLNYESGRGALLIATAYVDEHLTKLIEVALPTNLSKTHKDKLFKYPGQLSSFSSKIELAYVFRLISQNLYDSLNALRKIRNDAAHSRSRFELHELNEKLKSVYELGPGFSTFIKDISTKALVNDKMERIKKILENIEIEEKAKQEIFERIFTDKERLTMMEKQIPFWELIYGLSFLCGLLAYEKQSISKLIKDINTFSDLLM